MKLFLNRKGFLLMEVLVASGLFLIFALGIYSATSLVFKVVYSSRLRILETALISEQLEVARNLPYDSVGIINGVPSGVLPYTTTTVRNGVTFVLITTVRNIDDPFDGTITSTPADTSPADYKLVEISAICQGCPQQNYVILSTRVAPKNLEGASQDGALFVHVFDYNGLNVSGATVSVTNTATNPHTVITDTTDNAGLVQIVGAPTGTQSYHIRVSKSGYSSDYTVSSSAAIPSPIKPPSNVVSQAITEISFQIDRVGSLNLSTANATCTAIASIPLSVHGEKLTGITPDVYKFSQNITTNGSGNYNFTNVEFDKYHVVYSGATYDIAGSIPMMPIDMTPGLTQNATIVMQPKNGISLLVQVKDAGTGLPLSDADVTVNGQTIATGVGYIRQTDWSGGSGQTNYTDQTKYYADNGNVNVSSAGDVKLKKVGGHYLNSGWVESSAIDFGTSPNYNNIIFSPTSQPAQTGAYPISFQIASADNPSPVSWDYLGPDGTANTYYTATSTVINSVNNGLRYLRYKAFLYTENTSFTPTLSEVAFTYTNSCTPPGQSYFNGLSSGTYTIDVSRSGYTTKSTSEDVTSSAQILINLSPSE